METGDVRAGVNGYRPPLDGGSLALFDSLKFPVCVIGVDGQLVSRNSEFVRLFEAEDSSIRLDWAHPFFPEYRRRIAVSYLRALKGQERNCFAVMKTASGESLPVEIYLFPFFNNGSVSSILAFLKIVENRMISFDRSSTLLVEENISNSSPVYEFSPNPIIRMNPEGEFLYASPSLKSFIGYNHNELVKSPKLLVKAVSAYDMQKIRKAFQDILSGQAGCKRLGDIRVTARGDTERWMNAVLYPITISGEIAAVEMFIEDITRIKRLEQKVSAMSRIRVIGDITKGILHSFNNMINVILSRTQLLLQITEKESVLEGLRMIERTAVDGVRQVKRISDFIGEGGKLDETDEEQLIDLIEDAAEFARIQFKVDENERRRFITVEKTYYAKALVRTDIRLLRELILSIIFRVSQFIRREGTLTIILKLNGSPCVSVSAVKGVSTQAEGESPESLFGEVDVRRMAERINVKIIEEESPEAYTIQAVLPPSMVVEGRKEQEDPSIRVRGLDVMIVEDQAELKEILHELFNNMGNRVSVFENGSEALAEFREKRYDVLVTDYGIAGITGLELAARVKEMDENIVTVLLSGWMLKDLKAYKNVVDAFYSKPFKLDALITGIAKLLTARKKA